MIVTKDDYVNTSLKDHPPAGRLEASARWPDGPPGFAFPLDALSHPPLSVPVSVPLPVRGVPELHRKAGRPAGEPRMLRQGFWTGGTALKDRGGVELPTSATNPASRKGDAAAEYLFTVARDLMSRLLEDLLDVSRVTHGTLILRRAPIDLRTALERAVEASRPLIGFRQHGLHQALSGEPLNVEGDLARLVQVFSNLLDNAAKYTDAGGRIDLILEADADEVVVRVRDNGQGIPSEFLPRIFEIFAQDGRPLDRTRGGLGLGLSLVRRLVDMHSGRIEAHSEGPGCGAEFVVRLPRRPPSAAIEEKSAQGGGPVPYPPALRILVVDDNVDSADSMALLLSLDGHEVRTAFDGSGALTEAAEFQPQAVLLDIGLPGMDGYEVARRLRELPGLREVLMIAITGYGQQDDRTRSKAAGFDHHLVKPVDPEHLSRLLSALAQN